VLPPLSEEEFERELVDTIEEKYRAYNSAFREVLSAA